MTLVTRGLRDAGHPAGPGEATATARLALDLATLRGLGAQITRGGEEEEPAAPAGR